MTRQRTAKRYGGGPLMLELESRILLSADLPDLGATGDMADGVSAPVTGAPIVSTLDDSHHQDSPADASDARELVIIDAATPNADLLLSDLLSQADAGRSLEVVILDPNRDGIDQVNSLLADRSDIAALHIVSHGRDGSIFLGDSIIDNDELVTRAASIQGWSDAFTADGDILIYGCNLAAGPEGRAFVDALSRLTDADVAASDDLTGDAVLRGDWELEYLSGQVETELAVSADAQAAYASVLVDTVYTSHESSDSEHEIKGNENWGQTFQYTSGAGTYEVNFIELELRRNPSVTSKTITVEIRDSWDGTVLASGSIDGADLSTSMQWERIDLGGVELTDGQSYTIRVGASNSAGKVFVASDTTGGYADGTHLDSSGAPVVGEDLSFRLGETTNDAPVNTVPLAQNMLPDTTLTFSTANGNAISISDDAGAMDELVVTLGVNDGTLSLSQTTGLTFLDGDGVADAAMMFSGTQADINAALEGMTYTPTAAWSGTDTLTITTNDQGNPLTASLDGHVSLTASYSFDVDGSNSTGSQGATLYNGASIVTDPYRGNVLETDGVDDYVSVPGGVTNNLSQFSFSFWVRTTESGSSALYFDRPTLLGMEVLGFGADDLVINTNNGYIGFWTGLSGTDQVYQSSTTQINDDQWHLITLSNDGTSASLYVDGVFEASLATGAALSGGSFFMGAQNASGLPARQHSGRFDDARFFDRALTANEVSDLYGLSDTDQVNITVSGDVTAPVVTVDPLATSDSTPRLTGTIDDPAATIQVTVDGNSYAATNNGDGTWTLADDTIAPALADGTYDVSVTATDAVGNIGTDPSVNELVVDTNRAPIANDDTYSVVENGSLTTVNGVDDILQNDTDPDGDPLIVNTTPVAGPANGTLTLNADGTFTYTPDPAFDGVDTFTYEISDGRGGVAQATVTITVTPINAPPTPMADNYSIGEDGDLLIGIAGGVLSNDTDADGDALTVNPAATVMPGNGVLILAGDGSFTYSPNPDFNGNDSFVYQADDGNGGLAQATVTIDVTPVNDSPVARDDNLTISNTTPHAISSAEMLANDTDPDGDTLSIVSVSAPSFGTLFDEGNGNFIYTASAGFEGTDSFSYSVADPDGATATVSVFVDVTAGVGGWLGDEEPIDESTSSDDESSEPETETAEPEATSTNDEQSNAPVQISQGNTPPVVDLEASYDPMTFGEITLRQLINDVVWVDPIEITEVAQEDEEGDSDGFSARTVYERISALADGFEFQGFGLKDVSLNQEALWNALDTMKREMRNLGDDGEQGSAAVVAQITAGTSIALTAGFVSWVLRGGALASTLISTMPMWKGFDPLPLLAARRKNRDEEARVAGRAKDGTWSDSIKAERMFFKPRPDDTGDTGDEEHES